MSYDALTQGTEFIARISVTMLQSQSWLGQLIIFPRTRPR